jgi:hypothetical protein
LDPGGRGTVNAMTGHPSSPLAAAVGLVATAADGLRKLPRALGAAGSAAHRRYDELALHGQDVLAGRSGPSSGERALTDLLDKVEQPARPTHGTGPDDRIGASAGPDSGTGIAAGAPSGQQIARATAPGSGAADAVPPIGRTEPVVLPEDVQDEVAQLPSGADLTHDELPLPDFDHQTLPQLRGRLRTLGVAELVQLRDYEQAHAARLPVLTLLDNRIAKLLADTDR